MRVGALKSTGIFRFAESVVRNFLDHRMTTYAAAVAYRGLLGLFPFILLLVVLVGALGPPTR
jgi:membrane protein